MGVEEEDECYELEGLGATDIALLLANGLAGSSQLEKLTIITVTAKSWVRVHIQYSEIIFPC